MGRRKHRRPAPPSPTSAYLKDRMERVMAEVRGLNTMIQQGRTRILELDGRLKELQEQYRTCYPDEWNTYLAELKSRFKVK